MMLFFQSTIQELTFTIYEIHLIAPFSLSKPELPVLSVGNIHAETQLLFFLVLF